MKPTLVFDSGCGPCTRFRNVVGFLDAKHRMEYVGLSEADRTGMLDSVNPARRHRSFHLISPTGEVWSGPHAFPRLTSLLPGGAVLSMALAMCPPVFSSAAFAYGVLSRLHDSGSCSYTPGGVSSPRRTRGRLAPLPLSWVTGRAGPKYFRESAYLPPVGL